MTNEETRDDGPHRPPKYVEGNYKPHFGDPDADWAIYVWWGGQEVELYTTDPDGDAVGVVRRPDGTPAYEGAGHIAGYVYDGDVKLRKFWKDRIESTKIEQALQSVQADGRDE